MIIISVLITGFCVAIYISYKVVTKNYILSDILKHFLSEKQIDNIMSLFGQQDKQKIQEYEHIIENQKSTIEDLTKKTNRIQQYNNKIEKQNGKKEHNIENKQEKHEENSKTEKIQGIEKYDKKEFEELIFDRLEEIQEPIQNNYVGSFHSSERVNMYNNKYDYMTGEDFEIFISQILKKTGYLNVCITKKSGDQGVDIIAEQNDIRYAIQCKRYSEKVGNKAIQEVFTGKVFYNCDVGVVVTNNYFTQSAENLANKIGVILWDRNYLEKLIKISSINGIENLLQENIDLTEDEIKKFAEKIFYSFEICKVHLQIKEIFTNKVFTKFFIKPERGTRIKNILSCREEISFAIGTIIDINVNYNSGFIEIEVPNKKIKEIVSRDKKGKPALWEEKRINDIESKSKYENIEKYYYIDGDFTIFSLKVRNKIEILALCNSDINAANLYLSFSVKLKEEYSDKFDFSVAVEFDEKTAISSNENGVEFFGGKEENGEIVAGIPKWMDIARDKLLNGDKEEFLRIVEEANRYLDEFMEEVIKYIE